MSAIHPSGVTSVSVIAGYLKPTSQDIDPRVGKMLRMGESMHIHITPEVAAQWIGTLEPIAKAAQA